MNRIKEARKAAGLTQIDVCSRVGISQPQYSAWENGKSKVDRESIGRLAVILGVSTDYLLGNDDVMSDHDSVVSVPVLGMVPAGIPIEAIEDIVDWEEIPRSMTSGGKEYFGLRVEGDSMYPDYLEGDTIIVRRTQVCNSGDDCVVYVNGYNATLKQVKLNTNGSLSIVPRNPTYPPRTFTPQEIRDLPVAIAGVVVELRRKIK